MSCKKTALTPAEILGICGLTLLTFVLVGGLLVGAVTSLIWLLAYCLAKAVATPELSLAQSAWLAVAFLLVIQLTRPFRRKRGR